VACREYLRLLLTVLKPELPSFTWLRHATERVTPNNATPEPMLAFK
jgi:hypothetical protein